MNLISETETFLLKVLDRSVVKKAIITMDELNRICDSDPIDVGAFYLRFRALLTIYFEASVGEEGELAVEECVDASTFDLVFDREIYTFTRKSDYFWWSYIHKTALKIVYFNVTKHKEIKNWAQCLASASDESDREFLRISKKQLEKMIKDGSVFGLVDSAKSFDESIGIMLDLQLKRYLREGSTEVLVAAYSNLLREYRKGSNSCQKALKKTFFRDRPSRRIPRR